MAFDRILVTFRSRIFGSFLVTLLPILFLLIVALEFFLIPTMQRNAKQELANSTRVLTSAIRASAAVSIRNHLKAIAETNREIAVQHLSMVNQGLLSKEEAVKRLKAIFLSQKIGRSGYIYCLDHNGIAVVHPNKKVEHTDNTRFAFVRDQLKTKEGYLEYNWQTPGEESFHSKALYMVYFEPLDWIRGTTFQVFLPLIEVEAYQAFASEANLPRGNENILFVDNEKLLLDIGKELLEGLGYSVETRASSIDALEAFQVHPEKYDLVVTDMNMPKLTGEYLASKIQKIFPGMPILLCTGYSTKLDTDRLKSIGIKKVLMKPVTLIELATSVRTVLDEAKVPV